MLNYRKQFAATPKQKVKLSDCDPADTVGFKDKDDAKALLEKNVRRLEELQYLLYAQGKHALLIVLQGMDTSGKDGTIRHVMTGFSPLGCQVTAFKVPSAEEAAHDFLWRIHKAVPGRGQIGIFNRSHYEDVLVVRVRKLAPRPVWSARYDQINNFEKILADNGTTILKFFLHISKKEQKERLERRIREPGKHWKVNPNDLVDRKYWDDYVAAYEDALSRCSTDWAPWFVVPADHKWVRNVVVSQIIVETLKKLDMKFPKPLLDVSKLVVK